MRWRHRISSLFQPFFFKPLRPFRMIVVIIDKEVSCVSLRSKPLLVSLLPLPFQKLDDDLPLSVCQTQIPLHLLSILTYGLMFYSPFSSALFSPSPSAPVYQNGNLTHGNTTLTHLATGSERTKNTPPAKNNNKTTTNTKIPSHPISPPYSFLIHLLPISVSILSPQTQTYTHNITASRKIH